MRKVFLFIVLFPLWCLAQQLSSPDGKYSVAIDGMTYHVTYNNKVIIERSRMGVDIDNRLFESALAVPRGEYLDWCADLELKGTEQLSVDTTWTPLYGENNRIRDHYNQLTLHYEKGSNGQGVVSEGYDKRKYYAMDIIVRAYNEGIAFRYHFPETANSLFLHIKGEQTSFAFPEGTQAWYEEWAQGPYDKRPLKGEWFESERPLLLQLPGGTYVALLEAAMK
ncbi:MAG: glycoside hydrolase family 97 N-terminal domain-containing protein, partial [Prevotella sp.]|nr:glycoside hydrolase family 97 N-terminal domain-containing protein [Prevotella sp.]